MAHRCIPTFNPGGQLICRDDVLLQRKATRDVYSAAARWLVQHPTGVCCTGAGPNRRDCVDDVIFGLLRIVLFWHFGSHQHSYVKATISARMVASIGPAPFAVWDAVVARRWRQKQFQLVQASTQCRSCAGCLHCRSPMLAYFLPCLRFFSMRLRFGDDVGDDLGTPAFQSCQMPHPNRVQARPSNGRGTHRAARTGNSGSLMHFPVHSRAAIFRTALIDTFRRRLLANELLLAPHSPNLP